MSLEQKIQEIDEIDEIKQFLQLGVDDVWLLVTTTELNCATNSLKNKQPRLNKENDGCHYFAALYYIIQGV